MPRFTHQLNLRKNLSQDRNVITDAVISTQSSICGSENCVDAAPFTLHYTNNAENVGFVPGEKVKVAGTRSIQLQSLFEYRVPLKVQSIGLYPEDPFSVNALYVKISRFLGKIRDVAIRRVNRTFSRRESQLILGIYLGVPLSDPKLQAQIRQIGLAHVIVASGANLTIAAASLTPLLRRLFRLHTSIWISMVLTLVYSLLLGFTPSIIRALVMYIVVSFGLLTGRPYASFWALFLSILLILLFDPFVIFSLSFLLSLTATIAVVFASNISSSREGNIKINAIHAYLRETFFTQLFVFFFTGPLLITAFGSFNLMSLFPNLLLLWTIPVLVWLTSIYLMVSWGPFFIFGSLISPILGLLITIFSLYINIFSSFPLLTISAGTPSIFGLIGYYGVLTIGLGKWVSNRQG
ncbi:MAG TPA: ComEC/Rec2 family competence protein [Patescibacteria group bacterium]|nr:ComEC/Rec2 family competence protein [Patescibacteria group bacterium]